MFFFGLHISTAYHSYLINVLTNPRYDNQIDTVDEAIAAGLIFEVGENTVDFFRKEDSVSEEKFSVFNVNCIIKIVYNSLSSHLFRYRNIYCAVMRFAPTWMSASRKLCEIEQRHSQCHAPTR